MTPATTKRKPALTAEQHGLCVAHVDWALRIARGYSRRMPGDVEEFECSALEGLIDAARKFDPATGNAFMTFAQHRIKGAILDGVRAMRPLGFRRGAGIKVASLAQKLTIGSGYTGAVDRGKTLVDTIAAPGQPVGHEAEGDDELEGFCRRLDERSATIVRMYFARVGPKTLKKIAAELGLSESRVSQLLTQALELFRDHIQFQRSRS